mmetsp:Transcript_90869/g.266056  ORF Transcript_90869/g.266056 Transcript_90869/m.266056 type:complete len:339 (-) Transcript_90869:470-1486(-)
MTVPHLPFSSCWAASGHFVASFVPALAFALDPPDGPSMYRSRTEAPNFVSEGKLMRGSSSGKLRPALSDCSAASTTAQKPGSSQSPGRWPSFVRGNVQMRSGARPACTASARRSRGAAGTPTTRSGGLPVPVNAAKRSCQVLLVIEVATVVSATFNAASCASNSFSLTFHCCASLNSSAATAARFASCACSSASRSSRLSPSAAASAASAARSFPSNSASRAFHDRASSKFSSWAAACFAALASLSSWASRSLQGSNTLLAWTTLAAAGGKAAWSSAWPSTSHTMRSKKMSPPSMPTAACNSLSLTVQSLNILNSASMNAYERNPASIAAAHTPPSLA